MKNLWLKLNNARKIAVFLQSKYFDKSYGKKKLLEVKMMDDLHNHPLYTPDMYLNIIWTNRRVLWLQVGTEQGKIPR